MTKRIALVATAVLGLALGCARAAPPGCQVIAYGVNSGSCEYYSQGPGTYEVETVSGFRIRASSDNGVHWTTLVYQTAGPNNPASGIGYMTGPLDTQPGQLVDVAIQVGAIIKPDGTPAYRYQDGRIKAGDTGAP
jgi:hypothetical protein